MWLFASFIPFFFCSKHKTPNLKTNRTYSFRTMSHTLFFRPNFRHKIVSGCQLERKDFYSLFSKIFACFNRLAVKVVPNYFLENIYIFFWAGVVVWHFYCLWGKLTTFHPSHRYTVRLANKWLAFPTSFTRTNGGKKSFPLIHLQPHYQNPLFHLTHVQPELDLRGNAKNSSRFIV